jgi:hypothetical protein
MAIQKYDIRRPLEEGGGFEERFWSSKNIPVPDETGELAYIIHRVQDVTAFVRLTSAAPSRRLRSSSSPRSCRNSTRSSRRPTGRRTSSSPG